MSGKIAISDGASFHRVEKVVVGKVEGLQQYINVLELTAVARAVELAVEHFKDECDGSLEIHTDSMTAMYWAQAGGIKKKGIRTVAHDGALEYLRMARLLFGGISTFHHIPREKNPAGHLLAAELLKESPHTV